MQRWPEWPRGLFCISVALSLERVLIKLQTSILHLSYAEPVHDLLNLPTTLIAQGETAVSSDVSDCGSGL